MKGEDVGCSIEVAVWLANGPRCGEAMEDRRLTDEGLLLSEAPGTDAIRT